MSLLLAVLLFLLGGFHISSGSASAELIAPAGNQLSASLSIEVWPNGPNGRRIRGTLGCAPPRGSLPRPALACRRLAALRDPFAPVPKDTACTAIYGGPQVARVRGSLRAMRIDARFNRRNGCEIGRWNRLAFLFVSA
jgi:hypothetical protein